MNSSRLSLLLRSTLFAVSLAAAGCQTAPPVQEMSDARQAIMVAKEAGAAEHAADDFLEAVSFLESAEEALNHREYTRARRDALQAKSKALEALARSAPDQEATP